MVTSNRSGGALTKGVPRKRDFAAEYARRKAKGLAEGKSLSVIRGHARAGERQPAPLSGRPNLADPLERAAQLMRDGGSLNGAAKTLRISEERLRRHIRETSIASYVSGAWVFPRSMAIATNGRVRWIVAGSSVASELGRYWRALSEWLLHGEDDPHPLKRFIGMGVRDARGKFWPFETGLNTLSRLDSIGELTGLELYRTAPSEDWTMDPMEREIRREERRRHDCEQVGEREPSCVRCGERRPECLELHHIAGIAFDEKTLVILCKNCHAVQTDRQQHESPKHLGDPGHQLAQTGNLVLGWARLLADAAEAFDEEGRELIMLSRVVRF